MKLIGTVEAPPLGSLASLPPKSTIAPSVVNNRPSTILLAPTLTPPGCANNVPLMVLFDATSIAPSAIQ